MFCLEQKGLTSTNGLICSEYTFLHICDEVPAGARSQTWGPHERNVLELSWPRLDESTGLSMRGCITRDLQKMTRIPHQPLSRPARSPEGKIRSTVTSSRVWISITFVFKARTLEIISPLCGGLKIKCFTPWKENINCAVSVCGSLLWPSNIIAGGLGNPHGFLLPFHSSVRVALPPLGQLKLLLGLPPPFFFLIFLQGAALLQGLRAQHCCSGNTGHSSQS